VSFLGWWSTKVRQFRAHLRARVTSSERAELTTWLTPAQLALFDSMHLADQRHGLDVVATIRAEGAADEDLLLAGLLHDAGKGAGVGVWARVGWSLGERYGTWVWRLWGAVPGMNRQLERLRTHAERSAELAAGAGCSRRTVDLIRHQSAPEDAVGRRLLVADEAN
jgi:hypothetical protein